MSGSSEREAAKKGGDDRAVPGLSQPAARLPPRRLPLHLQHARRQLPGVAHRHRSHGARGGRLRRGGSSTIARRVPLGQQGVLVSPARAVAPAALPVVAVAMGPATVRHDRGVLRLAVQHDLARSGVASAWSFVSGGRATPTSTWRGRRTRAVSRRGSMRSGSRSSSTVERDASWAVGSGR